MLHTKFRENRSAGSGEEDFLRVFTIYGRGSHLGHVTKMPRTKYRSPTQGGSTLNLALIGPAVSEEKIFEHCERRTPPTDGRTPARWVHYKLTL